MRWRVTATGEIAFATQMESDEGWSVVDLTIYIVLFVQLAMRWGGEIGYFGEARLFAILSVAGLPLSRSKKTGTYLVGFNPGIRTDGFAIASSAILQSPNSTTSGSTDIKVNYLTSTTVLSVVLTLLNRLIRSLGHAVVERELEQDVRTLL